MKKGKTMKLKKQDRLSPQEKRKAASQMADQLSSNRFWLERAYHLLGFSDGLARSLFDDQGNYIGPKEPRVKDMAELEHLAYEMSGKMPEMDVQVKVSQMSDIQLQRMVYEILVKCWGPEVFTSSARREEIKAELEKALKEGDGEREEQAEKV